ncbi:zinc-binding dehydrogenase [Streptomyces gelaticus]|uniref:zinc-binding dehydrogenase n=1 Tax=Streptomyces gelaticus TaxID=285446 RepID=UPI0037939834
MPKAYVVTRNKEFVESPCAVHVESGPGLADRVAVARARTAAVLDEVAKLVVTGVLRTHVNRAYPLTGAGDALRAVESGHSLGKTVIEVVA